MFHVEHQSMSATQAHSSGRESPGIYPIHSSKDGKCSTWNTPVRWGIVYCPSWGCRLLDLSLCKVFHVEHSKLYGSADWQDFPMILLKVWDKIPPSPHD